MPKLFSSYFRSSLAVAAGFSLSIATAAAVEPPAPEAASGWTDKKSATAQQFMVAAAHPLAVQTGYNVLKRGGTAVDAAIAVQFMLNLVEPQSSGIGGGAFMLYWDAEQRTLSTFDGRETAPGAATPAYFLNANGEPKEWWDAVIGGRSVGVPGTLKLLDLAHQWHGTLPWPELVQPAIDRAEQGFNITPRLAQSIANAEGLDRYEATRAYFFDSDGVPLNAGYLLKNPAFAETLRRVAQRRSDALYRGPLAQEIVDTVATTEDNPGVLTTTDFEAYRVKVRDPVCTPYRRYTVCGMGPPTSGGLTIAQILGMLSHFDMPGIGYGVDSVHLFSEAAKLAYADRGLYMADNDFVRMPVAGLIDPSYLTYRAQLIDRNSAMGEAEPGNPPWLDARLWAPDDQREFPGTSHFSIVDRYGNALSMTTTIENGFGSRLMAGGFLLNNELTDFSFRPERDGRPVANRVEAGKRPRSSMSPTIVFNSSGDPHLLIGSPGGSRIINYVAKTLVAVLDWHWDLQDAINLGHFSNRNGATDLEAGTQAATLKDALTERGHEVNVRDLNSGLHGILIQDGKMLGGADPRREGVVMGD
ncbi:MAG: gamma-glutamyltransferase [Gammaproteobacteria bacterium]|nr:gamma-glutamyltransferase [Gammaproteobacteria bacterium]MDH3464568.1 gamma-glutamyltransferase [Gammaproteobacteria bacterium]